MKSIFCSLSLILLCAGTVAAQQPAANQPASPQAALQAYKEALEAGDVVKFAQLTAGPAGATLRKLSGPLKKIQDANEKLDRALAEKPALGSVNPFSQEFNPLRGYQLDVVEWSKETQPVLVRIRFGTANQLAEETVSVTQEEGLWRVSPPGEFLKAAKRLTPERLSSQIQALTKLTEILNAMAQDVVAGKVTGKEAFLVQLAQKVKEQKLGQEPGKPTPPDKP